MRAVQPGHCQSSDDPGQRCKILINSQQVKQHWEEYFQALVNDNATDDDDSGEGANGVGDRCQGPLST